MAKYSLKDHKVIKHTDDKGKKLSCPVSDCSANFRLPSEMKNHVMRVHEKTEKPYACTLCPEKYWRPGRLKEHMNGVHLNIKPFKCNECDFASAYSSTLSGHVKAMHNGERHYCPYPNCSHYAKYKGNLDKHINNVHKKQI